MNTPKAHVRINAVAIVIWGILAVPTILYWSESLIWIVAMSWYAIFISHITAYIASMSEVKVDEKD